jgi:sulfofructose kinase
MEALFIGHAYIDITFLTDHIPSGDEKYVAQDYSVSFGGNAVSAAFCCAKLGVVPDLLCTLGDDWLGQMFRDMARTYGISVHSRKVKESSLSFIMPRGNQRAIVRCRDDHYLHPFPLLNIDGCRGLHLDGHQGDASIHYAKMCRERGILTSLDGGGLRADIEELLELIDVAVVSLRLCEQMQLQPSEMLDYLKGKGCRIGGVTLGESGMLWYDEAGNKRHLPALDVPDEKVIDTNGAGDIFHGAYMYSYLAAPEKRWADHFEFARAASAHSVQHLGIEASLPSLEDIEAAMRSLPEAQAA